jgi:BirA family biotin operon repressor/biotin-[acetyl-CoA-carboxylase] ligase
VANPKDCAYPLSAAAIAQAAVVAGVKLPPAVTNEVTSSTNDQASQLALAGAPIWTIVTAEQQSAGRGRLDRSWESRAGDGLLFSVVLRPSAELPVAAYGWLPLMAGVAIARAVAALGVDAALKWPNDLIIDGDAYDGSPGPRKLAGILAERVEGAVIVGVGLNVCSAQGDLPIPAATSLRIEAGGIDAEGVGTEGVGAGAGIVDRAALLVSCVAQWQVLWTDFLAANGDANASGLAQAYRKLCATLGRTVRADIAGTDPVVGIASDIDSQGHLIIDSDLTRTTVAAADIRHLRRASG